MGRGGTDLLWSSGMTCTGIVIDGDNAALNLKEVCFTEICLFNTAELAGMTANVIGTSRTGN